MAIEQRTVVDVRSAHRRSSRVRRVGEILDQRQRAHGAERLVLAVVVDRDA